MPASARPLQIVFVSHDAHWAGAQAVLLTVIRWFARLPNIRVKAIILNCGAREGALLPRFEELCPTLTLEPLAGADRHSIDARVRRFIGTDEDTLIYSNTAVNGDFLPIVHALGLPILSHIHELEAAIRFFTHAEAFARVKTLSSHFIAVSNPVRDNLLTGHALPIDKISVIHPPVELPVVDDAARERVREELARDHGVSRDAFLITACGTTDWRKGADLVPSIARELARLSPEPFAIVWIGGETEPHQIERILHDAERMGVRDRVHFVGQKKGAPSWIAASQALILPSREDPFPLVCIEALAVGVPLICFEGSGGAVLHAEHEAALLAPYGDCRHMARQLLRLRREPELTQALIQRGKERAERFSIEVIGHELLAVVARMQRARPLASAELRAV